MRKFRCLNVISLGYLILVPLLSLLLVGCIALQEGSSSGVPAGEETELPAGEVYVAPTELPEMDDSAHATQDAAVEMSGKPGPTLPAGEVKQQTTASNMEPPSGEVHAGTAIAAPGTVQVTPGGEMQAPNPDELATREAALERSSKPGEETAPSCLGSVILALLPVILGLSYQRSKH